MTGQCAAFGCTNKGNHTFPKDEKRRKQWLIALNRKNFKASKYSTLCSEHFTPEDYVKEGFYSGMRNKKKILTNTAVPSIFSWHSPKKPKTARVLRFESRTAKCTSKQKPTCTDNVLNLDVGDETEVEATVSQPTLETYLPEVKKVANVACQTTGFLMAPKSMMRFRGDDKIIAYYTGLETCEKFDLVLSTLHPECLHLNYRYGQVLGISIEDQFLMTLIKLRRCTTDYELSKDFDVSEKTVGNIVITWINLMGELWSQIDAWPSRELVDYYMPRCYKKNYKSTRVIIDGTEIPIPKPSNKTVQQATWSTYKNKNTLKVLVGATPGGLISYHSDAYGGSTSDRQIVERSNLVGLLENKDSVMADRGFTIQDMFLHKDVVVNIPTFLKGKSQLPGIVLLNDRKLATKRVHIERHIGLSKTYKILTYGLNTNYVPLASKILCVCFTLCNFRECIMSLN